MSPPNSTDVARLLDELEGGDRAALNQLFPLVYDELRTLAHSERERSARLDGATPPFIPDIVDVVVAVTNPYLDLTEAFNSGRRRALISSGQAVVLHRLAIMSKDGDWVLREDAEATSSRDLIRLAREHPGALAAAVPRRPVLAHIGEGREALDEALDRERRLLMRADEARLARYRAAAEAWAAAWPDVSRQIAGLPLPHAHRLVVARAEDLLPHAPPGEGRHDRAW
jgi:hypothetical protein